MNFQVIANAIEKAPQETKDILFSEEIGQFLKELALENDLGEDTTLKMVDELGYIVLGIKDRSSLKDSLASMGLSTETAFPIIQAINKEIFTELDKIKANESDTTKEPIVITKETKEEALKELDRRSIQNQNAQTTQARVPEIVPNNLPMVEPGEMAHEVPHVEHPVTPSIPPKPTVKPEAKPEAKPELPKASLPDYRYPGGKDPYREPV